MNETAIRVENLSKLYRIGGKQGNYKTLRETLSETVAAPFHAVRSKFARGNGRRSAEDNTIWALKDVSFEIKRGDVVGVIGRNGAGKSTLLKILSRITEPTSGYADIHGRVGSLLEVGTGFHFDLTGRENTYLNGSILGMKREEIDRKFEEIVEFSEVGKFIDTPVKHYSSGMHLRLAFAVAAHLEPEVLLVDEVLAVGDVAFQRKCLGKMEDVAKQGRTVLFVSHNMSAVKELCQKGILLDKGRVAYQGDSSRCIAEYFRQLEDEPDHAEKSSKPFSIGKVQVEGDHGSAVSSGEPFKVSISISGKMVANPLMFFMIEDFNGRMLIHSRVNSRELGDEIIDGERKLELEIPALWLSPGIYAVYFKFILSSISQDKHRFGPGTGRFVSEKFMLEVHGEPEMSGKAALNPKIEWKITDGLPNFEPSYAEESSVKETNLASTSRCPNSPPKRFEASSPLIICSEIKGRG